jgi:hypothetical protein
MEEFAHAEAKRAVNRLRWEWKKDPWREGETIDLGSQEERFQLESGITRLEQPIAPAIVDWLRWRYRRLQIDRRRDEEWTRTLREEYPRRVREAGPPPAARSGVASSAVSSGALWRADHVPVSSKRRRLDEPRARIEPQLRRLPMRNVSGDGDKNALALVAAQHRDVLAPLFARCRDEQEQRTLVIALHEYLLAPESAKAATFWRSAVTELWRR